jgi:hypothetical protein
MENPFTPGEIRAFTKLPMCCFTNKLCRKIVNLEENSFDLNLVRGRGPLFETTTMRDIIKTFKKEKYKKVKFEQIKMILNRDPYCMPAIEPYTSLFNCKRYGTLLGFFDGKHLFYYSNEKLMYKLIIEGLEFLRKHEDWKRFVRGTKCY